MLIAPALALVLACSTDSTTAPVPRQESAAIRSEANYSFTVTPENRTVHVQFERVRSTGAESVSAFMQRVFDSADAAGALIGSVMKDMRGQADAGRVRELILEKLA